METLTQDPTIAAANQLQANQGLSPEAAQFAAQHIGANTLHEDNGIYANPEGYKQLHDALSIQGADSFSAEQRQAVGMSDSEASKFVRAAENGTFEGTVDIPTHIPGEKHDDYKKLAESMILFHAIGSENLRRGEYNKAAEKAPITIMQDAEHGDKRASTIQKVAYTTNDGRSVSVEVVRKFDEQGNETGLLINKR